MRAQWHPVCYHDDRWECGHLVSSRDWAWSRDQWEVGSRRPASHLWVRLTPVVDSGRMQVDLSGVLSSNTVATITDWRERFYSTMLPCILGSGPLRCYVQISLISAILWGDDSSIDKGAGGRAGNNGVLKNTPPIFNWILALRWPPNANEIYTKNMKCTCPTPAPTPAPTPEGPTPPIFNWLASGKMRRVKHVR